MNLSDQQLMLLEQLTYLEDLDLGISLPAKTDNLGQYVDLIVNNEKVMENLRADPGEFTSGEQWAAILQGIANDEDLRRLKPHDVNESVYARSFTDPDDESKGIVIFKGTADAREWDDDVRGLNVADTPCQIEARNYIEGLPFEDITVAGHSKGGNKAQYVTVTCDKVSRCISMDGQGFSQEFMDKYWAEIAQKGNLIKNYSLDADYVHILLFPVPGAEQIYIKSDINNRGMQNHSPANLLSYKREDKKLVLNTDENGPVLDTVPNELSSITYLRELTYFVLNTASDEDKQKLVDLIGPVLAVAMSKSFMYEGVLYNKDNILDYIMSQPDGIATLLAYLTKYIEVYELDGEQVQGILAAFGLIFDFAGSEEFLGFLSEALRFVLGNLGDQKTDKLLEAALSLFNEYLKEKFGKDYNLTQIWQQAEDVYESIEVQDSNTANQPSVNRKDKIRDFSSVTYNLLIETIKRIGKMTYNNTKEWKAYEGEPWYDDLSIGVLMNGIDKYYQGLENINTTCSERAFKIFENIGKLDFSYGEKLNVVIEGISHESNKLR